MVEWQRLEVGIRVRIHPTRRHGALPDRYFVLRYSVDGVKKQEALGWASRGWTLAKARDELAKLRAAARLGEGPVTLKEKRELARTVREAARRTTKNGHFRPLGALPGRARPEGGHHA